MSGFRSSNIEHNRQLGDLLAIRKEGLGTSLDIAKQRAFLFILASNALHARAGTPDRQFSHQIIQFHPHLSLPVLGLLFSFN